MRVGVQPAVALQYLLPGKAAAPARCVQKLRRAAAVFLGNGPFRAVLAKDGGLLAASAFGKKAQHVAKQPLARRMDHARRALLHVGAAALVDNLDFLLNRLGEYLLDFCAGFRRRSVVRNLDLLPELRRHILGDGAAVSARAPVACV